MRKMGHGLVAIGFILSALGGWMNIQTPVSAGANIGALLAVFAGSVVGIVGLLLVAVSLARRQARGSPRTSRLTGWDRP